MEATAMAPKPIPQSVPRAMRDMGNDLGSGTA